MENQKKPFGLDTTSLPFRLYQKSKQHGLWDPETIDFSKDRADWATLTQMERQQVLELVSMFYFGEQSVTDELLPLIYAVDKEGRTEETMYLATFLFEEVKHLEFFSRFLAEVVGTPLNLQQYHSKGYQQIFYKELPTAMQRLLTDQSPEAIAVASTTYHLLVEDIVGEIGFWFFGEVFGRKGFFPGLAEGFRNIARDEGRHIAYGTFLIQRLMKEHGDHIYTVVRNRMTELLPYCSGAVGPQGSHLIIPRMNRRLQILSRGSTNQEGEVGGDSII